MNDFMVKIFGLNWRSTVLGLAAATGNIVMDYLNGTVDLRTFLISFVVAIGGYILKDAKVTGTALNPRAQVKGQPPPVLSPEAKVEIKEIEEKKRTEE